MDSEASTINASVTEPRAGNSHRPEPVGTFDRQMADVGDGVIGFENGLEGLLTRDLVERYNRYKQVLGAADVRVRNRLRIRRFQRRERIEEEESATRVFILSQANAYAAADDPLKREEIMLEVDRIMCEKEPSPAGLRVVASYLQQAKSDIQAKGELTDEVSALLIACGVSRHVDPYKQEGRDTPTFPPPVTAVISWIEYTLESLSREEAAAWRVEAEAEIEESDAILAMHSSPIYADAQASASSLLDQALKRLQMLRQNHSQDRSKGRGLPERLAVDPL